MDENRKWEDINSITVFGSEVQKQIAELSGRLLVGVGEEASAVMMGAIDSTLESLKTYEAKPEKSLFSFLRKSSLYEAEKRKQDAMHQVERLETVLDEYRMQLLMDCTLYEQMYKMNVNCSEQLKEKLQVLQDSRESMKTSTAFRISKPLEQEYLPYVETRIKDLEVSAMLAEQQKVQIGLLRDSAQSLAGGIQNTLYNVIPLWKNQVCRMAGNETTKESEENSHRLIENLLEIMRNEKEAGKKKKELGL